MFKKIALIQKYSTEKRCLEIFFCEFTYLISFFRQIKL